MTTCAACGQENPPGFRFCGACGAALASEVAAEREERKTVTVLFADLVGFTSRSEALDPEDVRAILAGYHSRLRGELERYGGTVEKFIGDAVMAVFGAPTAHEDDPERAVRAALAIRDAIDEERAGGGELHVRIGVTTGVALIRLGVRPERGEGMAAGDVVNTAARLQSAAPVDGILVDEATFRATERAIDFRPAEPVQAKGKAEPVPAWEVVEARARLGADVALSARTPLVGRAHEKTSLVQALARARQDRAPQLVTVIGVPGIGKSRLVYELLQAVADDPELIVWRQGRCLPYGEGAGYRALADVVKAQAGILETDDGDAALAKLRRAVETLLPDPAEAARVERQLLPLAGLGDGARAPSREEAFTAWRHFVESLAEEGPAVVVLEDVHWADDMLLDFVEHLIDWAAGVPLLVLCVARPELLSRRPGWGGGKPNATTLSLSPLSDEEMARLVAGLLERAVMPADVQAALLRRAGGNPLYAEELVRLADESGAGLDAAASLPPSVEGIIAARLDILEPEHKALLQDAAVIGKVFWLGSVAALAEVEPGAAEGHLHELVRRQIVRPERRSAVAGETEYSFWHVLVREVAYGQIPRAERARKHRLAAEWITSLSAERLADRADLVAHHYLTAVDFARAAGQDTGPLAEPAWRAAAAAGERALSLNAYPAAERSLRRALELCPPEDPRRPRMVLALAQAIFRGQDAGASELAEARDELLAAGDLEGAAEAEAMLGDHAWIRGRTSETLERMERAAELVAGLPASAAKAYVAASASRFLMLAGRAAEAIATGRQALELAESLGLEELRAHALNNIGSARNSRGDRGGVHDLRESIAVAERIGSPEAIRGYINLAADEGVQGDLRRCRELHLRGYELAERFGQRRGLGFLAAELLVDAYLLGEWTEARERAEAFLESVARDESHYQEGAVHGVIAFIETALGHAAESRAAAERSVELARAAADPQVLLPALAGAAAVEADLGDHDRAGARLDELLAATLEEYRVALWIYPALHAFAELNRLDELAELLKSGAVTRWGDAARLHCAGDLAGAADVLHEIGSLSDEARTRLRAAETLTASGRSGEALEQLERAFAFYRAVGATLYLRRGERLLRASA